MSVTLECVYSQSDCCIGLVQIFNM